MKKLEGLRHQIDGIDDEILQLLERRADCALEIAKTKAELGQSVKDVTREEKLLHRLQGQNTGSFNAKDIHSIFSAIISASVRLQNQEGLSRQSDHQPPFENVGFVGFGLMGGSLALAIESAFPNIQICCFDPNISPQQVQNRFKLVSDISEITSVSLIVLAAPVSQNIEFLNKHGQQLNKDTLVIDLGSTKSSILNSLQNIPNRNFQFVGGHPLVGKHTPGFENADALLFQGNPFVLTPDSSGVPEALLRLLSAIGAIAIPMSAPEHDKLLGLSSHLPHFLAVTLFVVAEAGGLTKFPELCPRSFREIVRLAAADPKMWEDIFLDNQNNLQVQVKAFTKMLTQFLESVNSGKHSIIIETMNRAKEFYTKLDDGQGLSKEQKNDHSSKAKKHAKSVA